MRKLVTVRTIDSLTKVYDQEVLAIDDAEVDDHPSPRVLFRAGEGPRVLGLPRGRRQRLSHVGPSGGD